MLAHRATGCLRHMRLVPGLRKLATSSLPSPLAIRQMCLPHRRPPEGLRPHVVPSGKIVHTSFFPERKPQRFFLERKPPLGAFSFLTVPVGLRHLLLGQRMVPVVSP